MLLGIVQLRYDHRLRLVPGGALLLEHGKSAGGLRGRVVLAGQSGVLHGVSAGGILRHDHSGLSVRFCLLGHLYVCLLPPSGQKKKKLFRQRLACYASKRPSLANG